LLLRHPRSVLAVAALLLVVLGAIGTGVEDRLDPTTLNVPGTASSRANTSANRPRSRSCSRARRPQSTAKGPTWSGRCAATRK
jgi:hypothetical protein